MLAFRQVGISELVTLLDDGVVEGHYDHATYGPVVHLFDQMPDIWAKVTLVIEVDDSDILGQGAGQYCVSELREEYRDIPEFYVRSYRVEQVRGVAHACDWNSEKEYYQDLLESMSGAISAPSDIDARSLWNQFSHRFENLGYIQPEYVF